MNTYLIKSKVRLLRQCQKDFLDTYGEQIQPFTRKAFFYFHVKDNIKYVHKESLKFVYSNADTFTTDHDPISCRHEKLYEPVDIIQFLEGYSGELLPHKLSQNEKFIEYSFEEGEAVTNITEEEFFILKQYNQETSLTPFYNSMAYNLIRINTGIKLVDLKHFENKDDKPFFVYMYNRDADLNVLYVEPNTPLVPIVNRLRMDYPVDNIEVVTYGK